MLKQYIIRSILFPIILISLIGCYNTKELLTIKPVETLYISDPYIQGEEYTDSKFPVDGDILFSLAHKEPTISQQATIYCINSVSRKIRWQDNVSMYNHGFSSFQHPWIVAAEGIICYKVSSKILYAIDSKTKIRRWQFPDVSTILNISNGQVHVLDSSWNYIILNIINGEIQAKFDIKGDISTQLLFADGYRYLYNKGQLYVTDTKTGKLLWVYTSNDTSFEMKVANKILYIKADNYLMAFDEAIGTKLWQYPHHNAFPVIEKEIVYLGAYINSNEYVIKLNAKTGEIVGKILAQLWRDRKPIVVNGVIYSPIIKLHYSKFRIARLVYGERQASSYDYGFLAIDADTNKVLWKTDTFWGESIVMPTVVNGFIYFGVNALNLNSNAQIFIYPIAR